jgi:hypothetical protein
LAVVDAVVFGSKNLGTIHCWEGLEPPPLVRPSMGSELLNGKPRDRKTVRHIESFGGEDIDDSEEVTANVRQLPLLVWPSVPAELLNNYIVVQLAARNVKCQITEGPGMVGDDEVNPIYRHMFLFSLSMPWDGKTRRLRPLRETLSEIYGRLVPLTRGSRQIPRGEWPTERLAITQPNTFSETAV